MREKHKKSQANSQAQMNLVLEETQELMRANTEKLLEREGKLSDMEIRAERLAEDTGEFQKSASRVRKKQWWKNMKMKIIIGVVVVIIIAVLIVVLASKLGIL